MHYNRGSKDSGNNVRVLQDVCNRQELLIDKLQAENKKIKLDKEKYIQKGVLQERKRVKKIHDRQKQNNRISTKAASLASMFVVGYYMVAEELNLWLITEEFTRSEWTQAVLTSMVVWLIEQVYHANKGA